MKDVNLMFR
jgi:hypothetical protein